MTDPTSTPVGSVLVVEPDDGVALPLRCGLERAGHPVERVTTGAAALDRVDAGGLALVVLDARLPDMDGQELATLLAAAQPELALLVMTHGHAHDVASAPRGTLSHLPMPFSLRELLVAVHALVGHAPPRVPASRSIFELAASPCRGATAETVVGQVPQNVV